MIPRRSCPVLPRFGLNNVAPWLHHRPVKGGVSQTATMVGNRLRSIRLPGGQPGLIKAIQSHFFCDLMLKGRAAQTQAYRALVTIFLTKFRPIRIASFACPVWFVPLSNVQECHARRAV